MNFTNTKQKGAIVELRRKMFTTDIPFNDLFSKETGECDVEWDLIVEVDTEGVNAIRCDIRQIKGIQIYQEPQKVNLYQTVTEIDDCFKVIFPYKVEIDSHTKRAIVSFGNRK